MALKSNDYTNIKVFCRFLEMNDKEKELNKEIFDIISESNLTFHSSKENNIYNFNFDKIFTPLSTENDIYEHGIKNIIGDFLTGYNASIILYGDNCLKKNNENEKNEEEEITKEIIPRIIKDIFNYIYNNENIEFIIKISIIEINDEKIKDLININKNNNNSNLNIKKDDLNGICIEDLSEYYISTPEEIISLLDIANNNRTQSYINFINLNENYCKCHFIFILKISQINKKNGILTTSKLFLVDLGGIKNNSKPDNEGLFLGEEKNYDKSLITLKKVINYLSNGKSNNIPYKESKLTKILQECFGGNFKTNIIINCYPSLNNELEILNNLRFGEKIRKIKNKPIIKKEMTIEQLKKMVNELNEKNKNKDIRIEQLEEFILSNDLKIPKYNGNFKKNLKKNNIKTDKNDNIEEDLNRLLDLVEKENDLNNKINISDQIKLLKEKYISIIKDLNKKIQSLQKEISFCNEIKYKLQLALIEKQTRNIGNPTSPENDTTEYCLNIFSEFIQNIKKYKEIQTNNNILEELLEFEKKIKNIENEKDLIKNIINNNNLIIEKNINEEFIGYKKEILDKNIQIDIDEDENGKIQIDYEKDKKYLIQCLEDNKQIILQLKNEIVELQNKNTILENNENLNEKKIRDKNIILENNIKELKKKYEENQVKKLILEDNYRKLHKFILTKKENLNNTVEIKEIKQQSSEPKNIITVITGGKKENKI